jgi:hypothetical protein
MSSEIRPMMEINQLATHILVREIGVVDTLRFLGQFGTGSGDYTTDRRKWLDDLPLTEIASEIKAKRK